MSDDKTAADETPESPVSETLEGEGFSDTEDALKGADIASGTGQGETNEQQSGAATAGATEQNPNVDSPDGTP